MTSIAERYETTRDFYETPSWCVDVLAEELGDLYDGAPLGRILDPCAGRGAILRRFERTVGLEIRADLAVEYPGVFVRDALTAEPWPSFDGVVMNPPFARAEDFVRRALLERDRKGARFVAALLRLAFLEGVSRVAFHEAHPSDVFILSSRPSFATSGATDRWAYAWFVWGPEHGGAWKVCRR